MQPWYDSQEISLSEVKLLLSQTLFHRELHSDNNPLPLRGYKIDPNKELCKILYDDKRMLNPQYCKVTFEAIRCHPNWQLHAKEIFTKVIYKELSFGSHRAFYRLYYRPLMIAYAKGVVQECWAKPILVKFARQWLQHHYSYGASGFKNASSHFETIASKIHN